MRRMRDTRGRASPIRRRLRRIGRAERIEEARDFIDRRFREAGLPDAEGRRRIAEVTREIRRTGAYRHTPEELAYGAKVAWRHHARCIGRLFWESLDVIDCRDVTHPDDVAAAIFHGLEEAHRGGRVKSTIMVFAPADETADPVYVESEQVTQYAGYVLEDGGVLGDPKNVTATQVAQQLGWRPPAPRGRFDMLPLILRDGAGRRHVYDVPASAYREVAIEHPGHPSLSALGLKWYAVPMVSNMILTIGGVDYPCAPFNGFYMGTEIASRNFADSFRYDLLEDVAAAIGVSTADDPLWRDRCLTELNAAVLHSYRRDGVRIVDHHEASRQFIEFNTRERAAGRAPSADWAWTVPPQAAAACPVFHLPMQDLHALPNFYHDRAVDGGALRPHYDYVYRKRWRIRLDRLKRRWREWRRRRT